jgi:hypothetical protein
MAESSNHRRDTKAHLAKKVKRTHLPAIANERTHSFWNLSSGVRVRLQVSRGSDAATKIDRDR